MPKPSVCDGMTNTSARLEQLPRAFGRRRIREVRPGRPAGAARAPRWLALGVARPARTSGGASGTRRGAARRRRGARRCSFAARASPETAGSPLAGSLVAAWPAGRAGRADGDTRCRRRRAAVRPRCARGLEIATTWSARRACARRERGIVAPDLGARAFRVVEKIEVVDGHDLRRACRAGISSGWRRARRRSGRPRASRPAASRADATPSSGRDRDAAVDDGRAGTTVRSSRSFQDDENRHDSPAAALTATSAGPARGRIRRRLSAAEARAGSRAGSARAKLAGCYHAAAFSSRVLTVRVTVFDCGREDRAERS